MEKITPINPMPMGVKTKGGMNKESTMLIPSIQQCKPDAILLKDVFSNTF
jgi:hypothetical protein